MQTNQDNVVSIITRPMPRAAAARPVTPARGAPLRVLIIDDTPEDRMAVRLALETQGFLLTEADSGARGLAAAAALRPDCILLDYRLPDFDGLEMLEVLRGVNGEIPYAVVMLTGSNDGIAAAKLIQAGALDYLIKYNLNEDSLRRTVQGAVERFQWQQDRRAADLHNAQLAAIVTSSTAAIFIVGLDHRVRTWNLGATQVFGYSEAEAVGHDIDTLIVPEHKREERAHLYNLVVTNQHAALLESQRRRKDGSLISVEINVSPMMNAAGDVVAVSVVMRDITARKDHEAILQESERRLSLALDGSATGVWDWDIETDAVTWSGHACPIFGVETFAGTKRAFSDLVHPEDRDRVWAAAGKALSTRQTYDAEFRIVRPSGEVRWVANRGIAQYDDAGRPVRLLGTVRDITARKHAEAALRHSEARSRQILDSVNTFIGLVDTDGVLREANSAALAAAGITRDEAVGHRFTETPWWRVPDDVKKQLDDALRSGFAGQVARCDLQYRAAGDQLRWVDFRVSPVFSEDNKVVAIVPSGTDITDRKTSEEHISMLMMEVNHRAKNLLGVVQAIARQTATASRPEDFVQRFSERIGALAASHDLLIAADWKGVEVSALVRSQLAHFQELIETRITLEGAAVRVSVAAAEAIGMAMHELATNAAKHGALSNADGKVAIAWQVAQADGRRRFIMQWQEKDGPPVAAPTRRGFGSTVIGNMLKVSLEANVLLDYAPGGLVWRIDCPAERALES